MVDPDIRRLLDTVFNVADPDAAPDVAQLRAAAEQAPILLGGTPESVESVADMSVPGASSSIGVRVYRPRADGALSLMLYTHGGDGLLLDYAKALELFRKAAERGDADALSNLGWAYESGLGVAKDLQQATAWYGKAADQGHQYALQRLDKLRNGGDWLPALLSWWPFCMFIGIWLLLRHLPLRT